MLFTSYGFIAFIAILFVVYYIVPKKWQWPLLLMASGVFYWIADPRFIIFICVTSLSAWGSGVLMGRINDAQDLYLKENKETLSKEEKKAYKASNKKRKWHILLGCLILNIGILSVTKYTNFVINSINDVAHTGLKNVDLIIPMGISFYTFQTMSYIIDAYRGTVKPERNPFKVLLFTSFFPQLVQGPINRFGDLSKSLYEPHRFSEKVFSTGLMRILWGYFKKLVVADRIIVAVTALIQDTDSYRGAYVFVAMFFYAFELYCDFTGGIDITIGIAQALGINMKENFILPYFSKDIKEYWNRWHISMGSWFTDYIFYPLSVSPRMLKLSKWSREHLGKVIGKRVTVYLAAFIVWFTTGLWHGAAWNFIVWGLMNFVVIMISQELSPLYDKFHKKFGFKGKAWYSVWEIIRTIFLMSLIRMFDCYRNVPMTFKMVGSMFTSFNLKIFTDGSLLKLGLNKYDYWVLLAALVIILSVSIYKYRKGEVRSKLYEKPWLWYGAMSAMFIAIIVFGAYGIGYDSTQFIYNQF